MTIFSVTVPSSARRMTLCSVIIMFGRACGTTRFTTCPTGDGRGAGFSGVSVLVIFTGVSCNTPLPNCRRARNYPTFKKRILEILRARTIESSLLPRAKTVGCSPQAASKFCIASMGCPPRSPASVGTESVSTKDKPRFSVSFPAKMRKKVNATRLRAALSRTHAIVECRDALAIVCFVLLEEVDEVEHAVALSTHMNIRLSHFLLGF